MSSINDGGGNLKKYTQLTSSLSLANKGQLKALFKSELRD